MHEWLRLKISALSPKSATSTHVLRSKGHQEMEKTDQNYLNRTIFRVGENT